MSENKNKIMEKIGRKVSTENFPFTTPFLEG
jgi:hypothetical protein